MYVNIIHISVLAVFTLLAGCGSHQVYKQSTVTCRPYKVPKMNDSTKQVYLRAINRVRSKGRRCGNAGYFSAVSAVRWSDALYRAAYEHSHDMMTSHTFGHKGSRSTNDWTAKVQSLSAGSSFKERIENNGYTRWKNIAENIAMGSFTVDQVIANWVSSDRHCANMMNPLFTDVGMAEVDHFWTQDFAARQ